MLSACGSAQPTTQTYGNAFNPYGTNGFPTTGNNGWGGYGQALYNSAGQIIGYKQSSQIIAGQRQLYAAGTQIVGSANVNAGERITLNMNGAFYQITNTTCLGFINIGSNLHSQVPVSTGSMTLNGQPITSGSAAPTSGVLNLVVDLSPLSANCSVTGYGISIPYGVTKDYCTNTAGAPMPCP